MTNAKRDQFPLLMRIGSIPIKMCGLQTTKGRAEDSSAVFDVQPNVPSGNSKETQRNLIKTDFASRFLSFNRCAKLCVFSLALHFAHIGFDDVSTILSDLRF